MAISQMSGKMIGALILAALLALGTTGAMAFAKGNAGSLGKTTLDTEVSSWDVGDGQFNGEFITAEVQGVVIGLRAQHRFEGLLGVSGDRGDRVAVYEAATGDTGENNATWNYDWHVDLSNANGNAEGKTLDDYTLTLEYDFSNDIFGLGNPATLEDGNGDMICTVSYGSDPPPDEVGETLCQQSWNPGFGNDDFDPEAEGTYNLRLVLTPETFNGPPLAVVIQVNVIDE